MEVLQIAILALIQGITEFLPISSSGHLVLVPLLTGWSDQGLVFDIALHVGSLVAVIAYFYKEMLELFRGSRDVLLCNWQTRQAHLFIILVLATVPVVLCAPFLKDFVAAGARSFLVLGITSIVFGLLLGIADHFAARRHYEVKNIGIKHALVFGLFQALAIIPGTSRSGITMTAGRFLGYDRTTASRFSLLMSVPTILLALVYSLFTKMDQAAGMVHGWQTFFVGAALSAVTAYLAIAALIKWVEKIGFWPFVVYRVGLGGLLLFLALT